MSVYSDMSITREDALKEIISHLITASDKTLESVLFDLVGREGVPGTWLNTFSIVPCYDTESRFLSYENKDRYYREDF